MQSPLVAAFLCLILCASAFCEDRAIIQCDPGSTSPVPAWASPSGANIIEQLACGQTVSIIARERGDYKIQIGDRIAYVNAKYVRLPQTQEQRIAESKEHAKELQQPPPLVAATQPAQKLSVPVEENRSVSADQAKKQVVEERTAPKSSNSQDKLRVFVTDSQSWEMRGAAGFSDGTGGGYSSGGARPQNAEIAKTFGERCPQVTVTINRERANYIVTLDHEGGKHLARKDNKWAAYNKDGDMIDSGSTRSLGNSVKDACEAIRNDRGGSQ